MARRIQHRVPKKVFLILVDGETEKWYLEMLKQSINLPSIHIKPELPKKKALDKIKEALVEHAKHYDKVIWLVDYDEIARNHHKRKFQDIHQELSHIENVEILINNPCLEFWFLLHFCDTSKHFTNCKRAEKELKKYLADYKKTQAYFKNKREDIYVRLSPHKSKAIQYAKKLDTLKGTLAKAQLYKLFDILKIT